MSSGKARSAREAESAELLTRIRAERPERPERSARWLQAFERDWAKALDDSRQTYDLSPLHEVVRTWPVVRSLPPSPLPPPRSSP
ncbi:DUF6247 family protein [Kitasatospora sp. NPDC001660]